ncbi:serine hydroxymethyltransferase [Candidatus Saccharibacteria bacterium]|jgi:glycine hydroxymethyltransferase|nr:serine hydroxymethyltransferase [Candidatus Saccharibacteria bacterium]MBP9131615.1 serine hydroxymethyltransferase [Candidatus Saccharibacteria bacterium]
MADLKTSDPTLFGYLEGECRRQREGLELIPSENYVSRPVLEALGSEFTNKYSEGYPGRRYYGGQEFTDKVETETIERAKAIFGADHANVQVSSGAAANVATFFAWLEPGDTVLGMDLNHGGHLTHGSPVTYMAKLFNFVRYGMKDIETGEIDYDALRTLAKEHKPKIIIAGFSAYPRELDYAKIANIADEVGAVAMADMAHIAGLIAGGVLANPFDHGFHIITTTTHKSLRGPRGAMVMSKGVAGNPLRAPEKTIENLPTLIDRSVFPGLQGGPHMHQTLAIGVALGEAQKPEFKVYAQQVVDNAKALASALMERDFRLITNGTDNHLMLADVWSSFGVGGKEAEQTLDKIGLTLNKNSIAGDTRKPFDPSGIRLGTPAITTRGFMEEDMEQIAIWMKSAIENRRDDKKLESLHAEVKDYCLGFPIPSDD